MKTPIFIPHANTGNQHVCDYPNRLWELIICAQPSTTVTIYRGAVGITTDPIFTKTFGSSLLNDIENVDFGGVNVGDQLGNGFWVANGGCDLTFMVG